MILNLLKLIIKFLYIENGQETDLLHLSLDIASIEIFILLSISLLYYAYDIVLYTRNYNG